MVPKEYIRKVSYGIYYYRDPEMMVQHREHGLPAWDYSNGDGLYFENDQCHRLDGAAYNYGFYKYHFLNGKNLFVKC